ncbi:uncharacterized protein LOC134203619 [Armigeres subalbatus]|uniref:uncharacterized protein LOC134203619 n=1 Tax=Armigeres subalbatus TaxID=124917 RepID=UPI002ED1458F
MTKTGEEAANRIKRIVESRKGVQGIITRQQTKRDGAGSTEINGPGSTHMANRDAPSTQPSTIVLELIETDKNFPDHPSQVGKFLKRKGFSHFTEIGKVGRFRFKVETSDVRRMKSLNLEEGNLRIYEPKNLNQTIVFVRGVPLNFDEEEMLENIEADFPVVKVQRIKRRNRNKDLVDTYNIKVTVEGGRVPNRVKIYGCNFRAELYIFPIRQCKHCWRYGHGAKYCTSMTHCSSCGGSHVIRKSD